MALNDVQFVDAARVKAADKVLLGIAAQNQNKDPKEYFKDARLLFSAATAFTLEYVVYDKPEVVKEKLIDQYSLNPVSPFMVSAVNYQFPQAGSSNYALQSALVAEEGARAAADTNLQNQINALGAAGLDTSAVQALIDNSLLDYTTTADSFFPVDADNSTALSQLTISLINAIVDYRDVHSQDAVIHVTQLDKDTWNAKVGTSDSRLSDARTPTAHTHTAAQITDFNTQVDARVTIQIDALPPVVDPTISIGTVDTLSPGASATASVVGTHPTFTLNLGIPEGQGLQIDSYGLAASRLDSSFDLVSNGYTYLGTDDGNLYFRIASEPDATLVAGWTAGVGITGPAGADGADGAQGAQGGQMVTTPNIAQRDLLTLTDNSTVWVDDASADPDLTTTGWGLYKYESTPGQYVLYAAEELLSGGGGGGITTVADIAARDAGSWTNGEPILVLDATADPDPNITGRALYIYNSTGPTYDLIASQSYAVSTLQAGYDKSALITTDVTNSALKVRRGSGADADNILEGQNGAGTPTFQVTGEGNVTLNEINGINPADISTALDPVAFEVGALSSGVLNIDMLDVSGKVIILEVDVDFKFRWLNANDASKVYYAQIIIERSTAATINLKSFEDYATLQTNEQTVKHFSHLQGATLEGVTTFTRSITGITSANPAVVTVNDTAGLTNDTQIFITGLSEMTELNNKPFTITNVVAGTPGTFELKGWGDGVVVDSTTYTAETTGGTLTSGVLAHNLFLMRRANQRLSTPGNTIWITDIKLVTDTENGAIV